MEGETQPEGSLVPCWYQGRRNHRRKEKPSKTDIGVSPLESQGLRAGYQR